MEYGNKGLMRIWDLWEYGTYWNMGLMWLIGHMWLMGHMVLMGHMGLMDIWEWEYGTNGHLQQMEI